LHKLLVNHCNALVSHFDDVINCAGVPKNCLLRKWRLYQLQSLFLCGEVILVLKLELWQRFMEVQDLFVWVLFIDTRLLFNFNGFDH